MGYAYKAPLVAEGGASPPGSRHAWWIARCAKHGEQQHLSAIGGRCVRCQDEA